MHCGWIHEFSNGYALTRPLTWTSNGWNFVCGGLTTTSIPGTSNKRCLRLWLSVIIKTCVCFDPTLNAFAAHYQATATDSSIFLHKQRKKDNSISPKQKIIKKICDHTNLHWVSPRTKRFSLDVWPYQGGSAVSLLFPLSLSLFSALLVLHLVSF